MLTTITTDDHDTVTNALLGLLSSHPYREDSTGNNHPSCVLPFTTLVELPDYPQLPEPMRGRWAILTDRPGTDTFEVTPCTNHDHARTIFDTLRTYYEPIHKHFNDPTHPTPEPTSPPPTIGGLIDHHLTAMHQRTTQLSN